MLIRKGYKFRLKINSATEEQLFRQAGSCRFVWNHMLALQKKALEFGRVLSYNRMAKLLTFWKKERYHFLREAHSQALQQSLRDLDRALKDAFDPGQPLKRFPRFRKKGQRDSFRYPQGVRIEGRRVYLPKTGWTRFYKSREIHGKLKNTTVSLKNGKWHASFQVEVDIPNPVHPSSSSVGIDLGVIKFATLSDGTEYKPLHSFRKLKDKLAKEQRRLARKKRFSSNWRKQKLRVAKIYEKIANARRDFLHKVSTEISKNHALIIMEDLNVKSMTASGRGTIQHPGYLVKVKALFNQSILDQGWHEFRRMLEYKAKWTGGMVITVPQASTSTTCSKCGYDSEQNRPGLRRIFQCKRCGYRIDADLNAARNILALGHRVTACGSSLARGRKQEPAGNREAVPLLKAI